MKRYRIALFLLLAGIVFLFVGLMIHPLVPYQDPTPEMLVKQNKDAAWGDKFLSLSFMLLIASIAAFSIALMKKIK